MHSAHSFRLKGHEHHSVIDGKVTIFGIFFPPNMQYKKKKYYVRATHLGISLSSFFLFISFVFQCWRHWLKGTLIL